MWNERVLEDLLLIPIRNGLTKPSRIRGTGVKMIGMGELFSNDRISTFLPMALVPVTDKELETSSVQQNDLLFARQSLVLEGAGKCSIVVDVSEPTVFESHLIRLRINEEAADPYFIYYYFSSPQGKNRIKSIVEQVAAAGIRGKDLIRLKVPCPDMETQKKISSIFENIDREIECNNKINDNLMSQARSIYDEMFVKTQNREREIRRADEIFDIGIGKTPPRKEHQWFSNNSSDVVWVSISDMGGSGTYINKSSEQLTREAVERFNIRIIPNNTVLLSFKLTVGRVAITHGDMTTNEAIAHFKTDNPLINEYLYCYLKDFDYKTMGNTSSIATAVNSKIIKAMPFVIPTEEELARFHSVVGPMFEQVLNNQLKNDSLLEMRDILLSRAMSEKISFDI